MGQGRFKILEGKKEIEVFRRVSLSRRSVFSLPPLALEWDVSVSLLGNSLINCRMT